MSTTNYVNRVPTADEWRRALRRERDLRRALEKEEAAHRVTVRLMEEAFAARDLAEKERAAGAERAVTRQGDHVAETAELRGRIADLETRLAEETKRHLANEDELERARDTLADLLTAEKRRSAILYSLVTSLEDAAAATRALAALDAPMTPAEVRERVAASRREVPA